MVSYAARSVSAVSTLLYFYMVAHVRVTYIYRYHIVAALQPACIPGYAVYMSCARATTLGGGRRRGVLSGVVCDA